MNIFSPLMRAKFVIQLSRVEKYRDPHGKLKENVFLPLFNTNFISKSDSIVILTVSIKTGHQKLH
jgi:hypothetical protein